MNATACPRPMTLRTSGIVHEPSFPAGTPCLPFTQSKLKMNEAFDASRAAAGQTDSRRRFSLRRAGRFIFIHAIHRSCQTPCPGRMAWISRGFVVPLFSP